MPRCPGIPSSLHAAWLAVVLLLCSCATLPAPEQSASWHSTDELADGIGPYRSLSARLLVIEPTRRWQVILDWQAESGTSGRARLTHAASGTVVELRWQRDNIQLRDNKMPAWRKVSLAELSEHGIVLSPYALSRFLAGHVPSGFRQTSRDNWESRRDGKLLRVQWFPEARRLVLTDIKHGRKATLIVLRAQQAGLPEPTDERPPHARTPAEPPHA